MPGQGGLRRRSDRDDAGAYPRRGHGRADQVGRQGRGEEEPVEPGGPEIDLEGLDRGGRDLGPERRDRVALMTEPGAPLGVVPTLVRQPGDGDPHLLEPVGAAGLNGIDRFNAGASEATVMLRIAAGTLVGVVLGALTGLAPGIHANTLAAALLATGAGFAAVLGEEALAAAMFAALITHTFLSDFFDGTQDSAMIPTAKRISDFVKTLLCKFLG